MIETLDSFSTLVVAEMSVSLAYSHLQFMGIWPAHEHIHIIIRFHHYSIGTSGKRDGFIHHFTNVCQNSELVPSSFNRISYGLGGIMRHFEIPHFEIPYFIPFAFLKIFPIATNPCGGKGMNCKCILNLGC